MRVSGGRVLSSMGFDEVAVPFFGAFGAAWDEAMVARWSAAAAETPPADRGAAAGCHYRP
jgi:hypothetical protein